MYIVASYFAQNTDCENFLESPQLHSSNLNPQSIFVAKIRRKIMFLSSEEMIFLHQ